MLFAKSYYRDAKGRVLILMDIDKFCDKAMYVDLFIVDSCKPAGKECKLQTITYREMEQMIEKNQVVEFYPERSSTQAVWDQMAQDDEYIKTLKMLRDGRG